jgi:hypothetical protein
MGRAQPRSMTQLAWWLAWATLAGAVLQVSVQLPEVWRLAGPLRPQLTDRVGEVRTVLRNLVPVIGTLGVVQLSGFADGFIATFLPKGRLSVLGYANQLMLLPVALFGIAVSASSLPELARDRRRWRRSRCARRCARACQDGWVRILFYVVPSAVVFVGFGDLVIGLLLRSGCSSACASRQLVHIARVAGRTCYLVVEGRGCRRRKVLYVGKAKRRCCARVYLCAELLRARPLRGRRAEDDRARAASIATSTRSWCRARRTRSSSRAT